MSKMLSLIAGISVLALAGAASAAGPVSLTNAQLDVVTAGSSSSKPVDFTKTLSSTTNNNVNFNSNSKITDNFTKKANIDVKSHVTGNSASLLFDNEALGKNSSVQGAFSQETISGQGSS